MDLRQLRYFVAIVDAGSMSRAAERIFVAQTSLSEHIRALEQALDTALLVRHARGVRPTPAGLVLYEHASAMLKMQQIVIEEVRSCAGQIQGAVSVGIPNTVSEILSVPLLEAVLSRFPNVRLSLVQGFSGTIESELIDGKLDLAMLFASGAAMSERLAPTYLVRETMYVVLHPKRVQGRQSVTLRELQGLPLFCPRVEHGLTKLVLNYAAQQNVHLRIGAEVDSVPAMIGAATKDLGFAVLPGCVVRNTELAKQVGTLTLSPGLERPLALCRAKQRHAGTAIRAVETTIVELAGHLIDSGAWRGALPY